MEQKDGLQYIHISFDDVFACLYDITEKEGEYQSAFENPFLGKLKYFHNKYGAVFTLNCFNRHTGYPEYDIAKLPCSYGKELTESCGWLKFAFHARDDRTNYGAGLPGTNKSGNVTGDCVEEIVSSYRTFVSAICTAAGTTKVLDHVTRLGFFTGTLNNIRALRDCEAGIRGLLAADDDRFSYYLTEEGNRKLIQYQTYYDTAEDMVFLRSGKRLEKITDLDIELEKWDKDMANNNLPVEIFTHEYEFENVVNKLEKCLNWAAGQGYPFGFAQDYLKNFIK